MTFLQKQESRTYWNYWIPAFQPEADPSYGGRGDDKNRIFHHSLNTNKRFLDRLKELYQLWSIPITVDILAYTPYEFEQMLSEENSLIKKALEEEKVIYEKSAAWSKTLARSSAEWLHQDCWVKQNTPQRYKIKNIKIYYR